MTENTQHREKGIETWPCPTCGKELMIVTLPDDAVSTERCDVCYPVEQSKSEKAVEEKAAPRETGTDVEETVDD